MSDFVFKQGETIALALTAVDGDATGWTVEAKMKALDGYGEPTGSVVATATVDFNPGSTGVDPSWILTFPAANTTSIAAGKYGVDAKFSKGGVVQYVSTASVEIKSPVTV